MKRDLIVTLCLFLLIGLSVQVESAEVKPKRGGTLIMGIRRDIEIMNPLVRTRSTEQSIRDLMFESLLAIDRKGEIQPNLAESWEISQDGIVYTFKLRKGVKFHNGKEMTAKDAKFAIDYSMDVKNSTYGFIKLRVVKRVETPDRYTLKIHLKKPSLSFLSSLTDIQAFSVIPEGSLDAGVNRPTQYPPGTGPFQFVKWQPKRKIIFERFDDYWGQKAYVDRLIMRPIRNTTVRITALRAGDVDLIERTPHEWLNAISQGKIKGISFVIAPHAGFRQLVFNVAAPPFNRKKLRQAVAHAIDRKEIIQAAYFGFGEPTYQLYPRGHVWNIKGVATLSYDLEKARALVQEAGYKGELLEIMVQKGEEVEPTTLQAQLKKIGMRVQLRVLDAGAVHSLHRKGEFTFFFGGGDFKPDPWLTYGTEFICEPNLKKRNNNAAGYCDQEMDSLIHKAATEADPTKRKAIFKRIIAKVNEDVPELPLFFIPRVFSFRDYVKGFTTDSDGAFRWGGGGLNYTWIDK